MQELGTPLTAREYLADIWRRREFVYALPVEQLRTSHLDTFLGNVWHLGHPLLMSGVYYLVFGTILKTNKGIENFPLWLMTGVFAYQLTTATILGGATTIASRQGLMRSFRFPRAIIPISNTINHLMTFTFQLGVLFTMAIVTGAGVSKRWILLPLIVALHSALNLGGAFIAARLNDSFQDVQHLIPFFFRLLQYTSGVMLSVERITANTSGIIRTLVVNNPLVYILDLYRWALLGTTINVRATMNTVPFIVALLVFGFRFFRVAEAKYGRL